MKLLSLILAVMMIAGMIPISAVAAPAAGKIGMTLKTGQVDDAFLDYGELSQANADNSVGTAAETVADAQTKMQSVEAKFTADSKAEYGEGEPFYLAIDLDTTNLSQIYTGATGIRSLQLAIELPDGVELVNDYTGAGQIVANPTLTGKVANGRVVTAVPALAEYVGDTTASAATKTDRGKNYLIVTAQIRAGNYLIPVLHTGWDFIVALKVSTGATSGSKTIKLEPNLLSDGGGTGVVYSTNPNGQASNANNVNNADIDCENAPIDIVNRSAPPAVEDATQYTIVDKKNAPYIDETYANTASKENGPNDYIQLPSGAAAFGEGDKIVIFADADGKKKLGETKISKENVGISNGWGYPGSIATSIAGSTFRLIDEAEGKGNGFGYIHGENEVWIGRIESGKAVSKELVGPVTVTTDANHPDTPHNYNADVDAVAPAAEDEVEKAGSRANPIEVTLGDTVESVLQKVQDAGTTLPTKVMAPYEGGEKEVAVNWNAWEDYKQQGVKGEGANAAYYLHTQKDGTTVLRIPFPNDTTGGVQPTSFVQLNGTTFEKAATPVYGSVIYVKVAPRVQDYFIVNSTDKKISISGETFKALKAGDEIDLFASAGAEAPFAAVAITSTPSDGNETGSADYPITSDDLPAAGNNVWVEVVQKPENVHSERFAVTVSDGSTLYVVKSEVITGAMEQGYIAIRPDDTAEQVFTDNAPVQFYVQTVSDPITVNTTAVTDENAPAASKGINYDKQVAYQLTKADNDSQELETPQTLTMTEFNTPGKATGANYDLAYTIPSGTLTVGSETKSYENPNGYTISMKAISIPQIEVPGDPNDPVSGVTVTVTKNAPDGFRNDSSDANWDMIEVKGVKYAAGTAEANKVTENTTVEVYKKGATTYFTDGKVVSDTGDDTNGHTFTIRVKQLGREPDVSDLQLVFNRSGTFSSKKIDFTTSTPAPKEEYSLKAVTMPWSDPVKVKETDPAYADAAAVYAAPEIPTSIDLTYGWLTNGVFDDSTAQTKTITLAANGWTGVTDKADFDGSHASAYTVAAGDVQDPDNRQIHTNSNYALPDTNPDVALTMNVKLVSESYTGEDPATVDQILKAPDTTITNNAYPAPDKVTIANPVLDDTAKAKNITVKAYLTQADKTAQTNAILTKVLTGDGAAIEVDLGNDVLDANGGNLYFTIEDKDTAPCDPAVEVPYDEEPYVVWKTEATKTEVQVKRNAAALIGDDTVDPAIPAKDDAGKLAYVKGFLPTYVNVTVAHLEPGTTTTYAPKADSSKVLTVDASWLTGSDAALAYADIQNAFGDSAQDVDVALHTVLGASDFTGKTVTADTTLATVDVVYDIDGVASLQRPQDFNKAELTLKLTDKVTEDPTPLPSPLPITDPEKENPYVSVTNNPGAEDDEIVIKFTEADGVTATDPDMAGSTVDITYPGPDGAMKTVQGTLSAAPGQITINTKDSTPTFEGFGDNGGKMTLVFTAAPDGSASQPVEIDVPAASGAYVLDAVDPDPVKTLNMMAGTVSSKQGLIDLVGITTVNVTAKDGTTIENVPLKKNGAAAANLLLAMQTLADIANGEAPEARDGEVSTKAVDWKLYTGTKAGETVTWETAPVADEDWRTTLGTYDAAKAYQLRAELDVTGFTFNDKEVTLPNDKEVLAKVDVVLYDSNDPEAMPLKLTEGNNDLYHHGEDTDKYSEPAKAELDARKAIDPKLTKDAFKYDLVFFYMWDGFEDNADSELDVPVSQYLDAETNITMVGDQTFAAWKTAWEAAHPGEDISSVIHVEEKVVGDDGNGSSRAQLYDVNGENHIQPKSSSDRSAYFNAGVNGGTVRGIEEYQIVYTIEDGENTYIGVRNVKLRYRPGDADLDGTLRIGDKDSIVDFGRGMYSPFMNGSGDPIAELCISLMDFDGDQTARIGDGDSIVDFNRGLDRERYQRF